MNLKLADFQETAVESLVRRLRGAMANARDDLQSLTFSSPTGSGKTVMATAAIERILEGDDGHGPRPEARFLWVTDQPELNLQTFRKMADTSTVLGQFSLAIMDETFDQETLYPGTVHFLNVQKLGEHNSFAMGGTDRRTFGFYETLRNTAERFPNDFVVIIDEAHRGAKLGADRNTANGLMQRLVLGHGPLVPPLPVVLGISATPKRFQSLMNLSSRVQLPAVDVPVEAVRLSGLLKDTIVLDHPDDEGVSSDTTLLREAVRSWKGFEAAWAAYAVREGGRPVQPLLMIQVEDGGKTILSKTPLDDIVRIVDEEAGGLPDAAYAHAFQEGTKATMSGRPVRYLEPSRIDADPSVRVVFFKTSLNTGWDCPRAEVMMSFRRAVDDTLIAQLMGRMVRTPLARRIVSDDTLNKVTLFLPHFDRGNVTAIQKRLSEDEENRTPGDVVDAKDLLTLTRAVGMEAAFAALEAIPNVTIPGVRRVAASARLMKFGRSLSTDGLRPEALNEAKATILDTLDTELARLEGDGLFQERLARRATLAVRRVELGVFDLARGGEKTVDVELSPENLQGLFDSVGRKIGNGLHLEWRRRREDRAGVTPAQARLEAVLLIEDAAVRAKVETACKAVLTRWEKETRQEVRGLPEERKAVYREIMELADGPSPAAWELPERLDMKRGDEVMERHLYADAKGSAPVALGTWERMAVEEELAKPGVVGWLRNEPRKAWSFKVPYGPQGKQAPMYPDLFIVRKVGAGLVVDILDPHNPGLDDAVPKAQGLLAFARENGSQFGRIEMIALDSNDVLKRLDLTDMSVQESVAAVRDNAHLKRLFDESPSNVAAWLATRREVLVSGA